MPLYKITKNEIQPVERTTFSNQNILERANLQEMLKKHIEAISPDTLIVAEEFSNWDDSRRRIDLLGVDKNANLVVIELKRTDDGGEMDLQSIRYAAMISPITFEKLVPIYQKYLIENDYDGDATSLLLDFLSWEEVNEDGFAQNVRIVLAAADFNKEITTSVLWLNDSGLDIQCVRMHPYKDGEDTLLDIQRVIPVPEAIDFQIQIREKKLKEKAARATKRDTSTLNIYYDGQLLYEGIKKADIGNCTVKLLQKFKHLNDITFNELRNDKTCSIPLIKSPKEITESEKKYNKYRVHLDPDLYHQDQPYYVARNWHRESCEKFQDIIHSKYPKINIEFID